MFAPTLASLEVTLFTKADGPLTKRISLDTEGRLVSDGSCCVMWEGTASRARLADLGALGNLISSLSSNQAIGLGAMVDDVADQVPVVTKRRQDPQGAAITRTADYLVYRPNLPALALIDIDTKGMPQEVKERIDAAGGYWPALLTVIPELAHIGRVSRASTSAGLSRSDTGTAIKGSDGQHTFVLVRDGQDVARFLQTLHDRCWLGGLGWMMVGAAGQLLERSLIDRTVYAPERLVFEGPPVLVAPLVQDRVARQPRVREGEVLDTRVACPPLRLLEKSQLKEMRSKEAYRLGSDAAIARATFIARQVKRISEKHRIPAHVAHHVAERAISGILLSHMTLPFDSSEFTNCTVGDVLADPERFVGATLADPLEGPPYGVCKAIVMRGPDGTPWIHSFAHGRTTYVLKHDAADVERTLEGFADANVAAGFVRLLVQSDVSAPDEERLRKIAAKRGMVGVRALDRDLKQARKAQEAREKDERQHRAEAERSDPRPRIPCPDADAPWLEQMQVLNDVLGGSTAAEPPMRDSDGYLVTVRLRRPPNMHALTSQGANAEARKGDLLPVPEQHLLTRCDEVVLSERIEEHIDYVDRGGESVHLPPAFVRHFMVRHDGALPVVLAVTALPMVLPTGTLLSGRGLNSEYGVVFRVPTEIEAIIPIAADCSPSEVARAYRFLVDEWLRDVLCDAGGKAVLVAAALTLLERLLLPERPAFFISAGQRGGGKTTAVSMLALGVLGIRPAAAAWSGDVGERRKALLAYLGEGMPLICWDNIPRGTAISCDSIERALTAETYTDRVLGVSESRTVPATAIQFFTGNNIAPRSDMASRSLCARLSVDRPDPENRHFHHPDPFRWTNENRGRILSALYTILLGNPRLRAARPAPAETRFKTWWHLVGSAIEHAAAQYMAHVEALTIDGNPACAPQPVSFTAMFRTSDDDDEQTGALVTVLTSVGQRWPNGFQASDVAAYLSGVASDEALEFRSALETASGKAIRVVTSTALTWRLKAVVDTPVVIDGITVSLRYMPDKSGNGGAYKLNQRR